MLILSNANVLNMVLDLMGAEVFRCLIVVDSIKEKIKKKKKIKKSFHDKGTTQGSNDATLTAEQEYSITLLIRYDIEKIKTNITDTHDY